MPQLERTVEAQLLSLKTLPEERRANNRILFQSYFVFFLINTILLAGTGTSVAI